jgi:hypothetical protein
MGKTRFALYFYYLAIGLLTACAITIVVKLIVFPPCAPQGNTCVVDPWSAAGLEGAILAVSATVLAILGAVAVAGWWTSLNTRVADQVTGLYEDHKKEIGKKLDEYVVVQQREMSDRLGAVQTNLQSVESRISGATTDINELEELTHAFLDVAVDGIMLLPTRELEEWAQKVTAFHKFSMVPLKMAERYLDAVEAGLPAAEKELLESKDRLSTYFQEFQAIVEASDTSGRPLAKPSEINQYAHSWLKSIDSGFGPIAYTLLFWESVLRWRTIAENEKRTTI